MQGDDGVRGCFYARMWVGVNPNPTTSCQAPTQ